MLIPREIFSVHRLCQKGSSRFALSGVRIERDSEGPVAIATDGRVMIAVRWTSDAEVVFPGEADTAVNGFGVTVPVEACKDAGKMVRRKSKTPIANCVLIDESSTNGVVPLKGTNLETKHSIEARAVEGRYPRWKEIAVDRPEENEVRILVNPRLLAEALLTMADVATTEYDKAVEVRFPKVGGGQGHESAIHIVKRGDLRKAHAIVMTMDQR